jgi:hypothetical protein
VITSCVIGSEAAAIHFPDFRTIKDKDAVSKTPIKGWETHYSPGFDYLLNQQKLIASPDELYTIKVSHAAWNIHWEKTMHDIEFFQLKGCKVIEEFYQALYKDWEIIHGAKKAHLNVYNDDFFTCSVNRKYDHDWLHEQMMYYDTPMYFKIKTNKEKAFVEKKLFDNLSFEDKIRNVREEAFVVALERFMIPSEFMMNPSVAYRKALKALITHMTKGWWPRFIIENWYQIKPLEDCDKYINFIKTEGRKYEKCG